MADVQGLQALVGELTRVCYFFVFGQGVFGTPTPSPPPFPPTKALIMHVDLYRGFPLTETGIQRQGYARKKKRMVRPPFVCIAIGFPVGERKRTRSTVILLLASLPPDGLKGLGRFWTCEMFALNHVFSPPRFLFRNYLS